MANQIKKYKVEDGREITLSFSNIRSYIADNQAVTDQECMMFMAMCSAQKLDPFNREAYLIKYGDKPASMVVGKDVFTKRAQRNPRCRGYEAGVYVMRNDAVEQRKGSMVLPGEKVVGGWASVRIEGFDEPIFDSVSFDEYAGKRKDGSLNGQWAKMPGTMIRKVALVHALREAFPDDLGGLYDSSEIGMEQSSLPDEPVMVQADVIETAPVPQQPAPQAELTQQEAAAQSADEIPLRKPLRYASDTIEF